MNQEAALSRPLFFGDPLIQVPFIITATDLIDLERLSCKFHLKCPTLTSITVPISSSPHMYAVVSGKHY